MSSESYLLIDFKDLKSAVIKCGHCQTEVVAEASNAKAEIPADCPSCRTPYSLGTSEAFSQYQEVYRVLSDKNVRIRVPC